jgi:hypothetical protein
VADGDPVKARCGKAEPGVEGVDDHGEPAIVGDAFGSASRCRR